MREEGSRYERGADGFRFVASGRFFGWLAARSGLIWGRFVRGFSRLRAASGENQVGQGEERLELGRVFGKSPVAHLAVLEEVFDDVEGVFDIGAQLRLGLLKLPG